MEGPLSLTALGCLNELGEDPRVVVPDSSSLTSTISFNSPRQHHTPPPISSPFIYLETDSFGGGDVTRRASLISPPASLPNDTPVHKSSPASYLPGVKSRLRRVLAEMEYEISHPIEFELEQQQHFEVANWKPKKVRFHAHVQLYTYIVESDEEITFPELTEGRVWDDSPEFNDSPAIFREIYDSGDQTTRFGRKANSLPSFDLEMINESIVPITSPCFGIYEESLSGDDDPTPAVVKTSARQDEIRLDCGLSPKSIPRPKIGTYIVLLNDIEPPGDDSPPKCKRFIATSLSEIKTEIDDEVINATPPHQTIDHNSHTFTPPHDVKAGSSLFLPTAVSPIHRRDIHVTEQQIISGRLHEMVDRIQCELDEAPFLGHVPTENDQHVDNCPSTPRHSANWEFREIVS